MYEKYTKLPDYSEWTKKKTVYKCMTDIKCENGMFTTGSYVMLNVCSAEESEIYVIDFISVCKKVKEDFHIINYTNDISETVEYDTISLLPNQLSNYFEEVKELNQKIKAIENSEIISIFLVLLFFAIPIFLSLLASNAMNASDNVIIPVESGIYAYEGLDKMLNKVASINHSTNRNLRLLGILLNKQQRTNVSVSLADSIRGEYKNFTFRTTIPYCPAQTEKAIMNQKGSVFDKNSSLGQAYRQLAQEIVEREK